jgi:Fe-S-cluster containining protein
MNHNNSPTNGNQSLRMESHHSFRFNCYPGVPCFTHCCQDITIVLTPYDVLRLKKTLGISSDELLEKYTMVIPKKNRLIPLVILKMNEADKRCPFVTQQGCIVYEDRPWPCRMYPLDMADDGTFHLITDASRCQGLEENDVRKISDWLKDQGVEPYDEMNEILSSITFTLQGEEFGNIDNPKIAKMVFMAMYNLDKFRDFVFKSSFLDRFYVEAERIDKIKADDFELLKFAYDWIKFGLFGEKLFWVKEQPSK